MATKIQGIEGLTPGELRHQIDLGGRFVYYKYTISVVVMTFRRGTDIYFVKPSENRMVKGLGWTALTFLLGWWGIPWGPIFTIGCLWTNLRGGEDVTIQVLGSLGSSPTADAGWTPPASLLAPPLPPQPPPLPGAR